MIRYLMVGLGGVGGYYGGLLAKSGRPVTFVVRSGLNEIRASGLHVQSPAGNYDVHPVAVCGSLDEAPAADVVVVTIKAVDNPVLRPHLARLVAPGGCVLLVQNGFGAEMEVAGWLPREVPVLGGLAFLCSRKEGPGRIVHEDYGGLRMGVHDSADASTVERGKEWLASLVQEFQSAGVDASADRSLEKARWQKLVWNVPFNGLSVVLDSDTRSLVQDPASRELVRRLMLEVVGAARARGYELAQGLVDRQIADTERMVPYQPSMRLDWLRGQRMEIDAIYGRPIAVAQSAGFEMTTTAALRDQLQFLQSRRQKENT